MLAISVRGDCTSQLQIVPGVLGALAVHMDSTPTSAKLTRPQVHS